MEPCLLWEQTKDLAKDRGFEMSDKCPMDTVCTGEKCVYLADEETDEDKLTKLREELKNYIPKDTYQYEL